MKNIFLLFVILTAASGIRAQEKIWLDAGLNFVDSKKDASFYQLSEKSDSSGYHIKIYRLNKTLLMTGNAFDSKGIQLNGMVKWYHENGNLESKGYYSKGSKTGIWKRFDKNGTARTDRVYSDVNMNNYIFNSALVMPKPSARIANINRYIKNELVKLEAFEIVALMPINTQFVVFRDGHVGEIKIDEKLSRNQHYILKNIIESMPPWSPGTNGTQSINVRIDVVFDNRN